MAENTVRVENSPTNPLYTATGTSPAITGAYVFSTAEQPGVVAANNFMTLFNPIGSGRVLSLGGVFISSYAAGDIDATVQSMRGFRISAASGGTLAPASSICRFDNTKPEAVGEIRTGGVTATLDDAIFNSPPLIGAVKTSSAFVHQVPVPQGAGGFLFRPGEGMTLRTAAGDVDTRWNLSIAWFEI